MDHYLATIQTILDRCDDNNTSPSIDDMEIIKIGNYIPQFFGNNNLRRIFMAYLAVNRNGEELVFNDCPIYDRVEDTWKKQEFK